MPLLPSLDPDDVWGDPLNDAIRALTRAPMSHSSIVALTNVEEGTLVPCTTHADIVRWNGSAWVLWSRSPGIVTLENVPLYLRCGSGEEYFITPTTNEEQVLRHTVTTQKIGQEPSGKPIFRFDFAIHIVWTSGMAADLAGVATYLSTLDVVTEIDQVFYPILNPDWVDGAPGPDQYDGDQVFNPEDWPRGFLGTAHAVDVSASKHYYADLVGATSDSNFTFLERDQSLWSNFNEGAWDNETPFDWATGDILDIQGSIVGKFGQSA